MRSIADLYQGCMAVAHMLPSLDIWLADAVSYALAEDMQAPFNLPVVNLPAYDGYAVRIRDCEGVTLELPVAPPVIREIRVGAVDPAAPVPDIAIRITSGAPILFGAEAVVSLEFMDRGVAQVALRTAPTNGENIRCRAEDVVQGDMILRSGTRIDARQTALLAGVDRDRMLVHPCPRIVVVPIGDETVEPSGGARPGTVFDADGHALLTVVVGAGTQTFRVAAIPDERARLRETIEGQLVRTDLILMTGGISHGNGNTACEVLGALGTARFDNITAWSGHIMGVNIVDVEGGQPDMPIVHLPGDLVSAQVYFEVFVRPVLRHMQGWTTVNRLAVRVAIGRSWYPPWDRRKSVCVCLAGSPRSGYNTAVMGTSASLLLSAFAGFNALAVAPEDMTAIRASDRLQCLVLE